jgi:hypothetical protein
VRSGGPHAAALYGDAGRAARLGRLDAIISPRTGGCGAAGCPSARPPGSSARHQKTSWPRTGGDVHWSTPDSRPVFASGPLGAVRVANSNADQLLTAC